MANIAKGPRLVNPATKLGISRSWKDQVHMVRVNEVAPFQITALAFALCVLVSCGRNERMDTVYAQRCLGCHGAVGKGDGPISPSLPVGVPDFRETVRRKNVLQIRRAISDGSGMMPAFEPALSGSEIQDMVIMVRLLSREDRNLQWWEKFDSLVWAHCSVPWEYVLGYDEPPEQKSP